MYQWMKKYLDPICPLFAILPLLSCFGLNMLIYSGTMVMCADWYHYDLTTSFDQAIPLVPGLDVHLLWMFSVLDCELYLWLPELTGMTRTRFIVLLQPI